MKYSATTAADVEELIARIRPRDEEELRLSGMEVRGAVEQSYSASLTAISARDEASGRLYGICGTIGPTGYLSDEAVIWGLGTVEMDRHPVSALKATKAIYRLAIDGSPATRFRNAIPQSFKTYLRWASAHLGATFDGEFTTPTGARFASFHITKGG